MNDSQIELKILVSRVAMSGCFIPIAVVPDVK